MKKIVFIMVAALLATACQESLEDRCEREAKEYEYTTAQIILLVP